MLYKIMELNGTETQEKEIFVISIQKKSLGKEYEL